MNKPIYLDYNASTPLCAEAKEIMIDVINNNFGNPSSSHYYGFNAKKIIEEARKQVAKLIDANADEIIFTSGGTESNNMAIKGYALANKSKGNKIVTSKIEHPAVIEVCNWLEKQGFEVVYIDVDKNCFVNIERFKQELDASTILVSIMHANNETGAIQNIEELNKIAKAKNIAFHCDAAQSVGKTQVNVKTMGIDLLSIAGHKLYAPKGIGALYIKRGTKLQKFMHGANHEGNYRAGTENIIEIAGLGKACEVAQNRLKQDIESFRKNKAYFINKLSENNIKFKLNGTTENSLPNTINVSFLNVSSEILLSKANNIAASAGAACHANGVNVSSVLQAMKLTTEQALNAVRFSIGRQTTVKQLDEAIASILKVVTESSSTSFSKNLLTEYTHGLGCACKLSPEYLSSALKKLQPFVNPNALAGIEGNEDAAVYKIDDETAIVVSVDFFTPIIDDPYDFGKIAATNALSDIYAMGAKPVFALNLIAFPKNTLGIDVLEKILQGANEKCIEAEVAVLGGHSIEDNEPKFGMVAIGIVNPKKLWKNKGLKAGNDLILTKPIGSGILSTALKRKQLPKTILNKLSQSLQQLNKTAYNVLKKFKPTAVTDITGFGLLGHLHEMLENSKVGAKIEFNKIPLFESVADFAAKGFIAGGTKANLKWVKPFLETTLPFEMQAIACDAQTSGGLLFGIDSKKTDRIIDELNKAGLNAKVIGKVTNKHKIELI